MSPPILIAIHGASGRMGQAVLRAASAQQDIRTVAALVRPGSGLDGEPLARILGHGAPNLEFSAALDPDANPAVLIDFSGPHAFDGALALAIERRVAFVSGTTALAPRQHEAMDRAAALIPILWSANFSLGTAVLARFAREAARLLPGWDCEIVEAHHRRKEDAPSGTALILGRAVAEARGLDFAEAAQFARVGEVGLRPHAAIGFASVRGGDIVGEHTVLFAGEGERIELTHRATSRDIFAQGAVAAAAWIAARAPGTYTLGDILAVA